MNDLDKLTEYFKEFPGIGPRQAKRFVYFLLRKNPRFADELAALIPRIRRQVSTCPDCFLYFVKQGQQTHCSTCSATDRDTNTLLIVARDSDLEAVEKSSAYTGHYFVLGGALPILADDPQKHIRLKELTEVITRRTTAGLNEIIIALNANPDGDNTAQFLKQKLTSTGLRLTILGRGLSTGSELEYADSDTIRNALQNRA